MTATLRGLLAIALLVGLYLIPVALVFTALFFLSFLVDIAGGSQLPGIFIPFVLFFVGVGFWGLLYLVFATVGVTGTPQDASAAIDRDQAPGLWDRVTSLARCVGTRPPAELRLTAHANPRVIKRKMSNWKLKRPAHCQPSQRPASGITIVAATKPRPTSRNKPPGKT
jgi:energy-coupling factor transporter transmembrane protein EcfT